MKIWSFGLGLTWFLREFLWPFDEWPSFGEGWKISFPIFAQVICLLCEQNCRRHPELQVLQKRHTEAVCVHLISDSFSWCGTVWTATTQGSAIGHPAGAVTARLVERVWCTKFQSSLLNFHLRHSGFQPSLLPVYFRDGRNTVFIRLTALGAY